MCQVCVYERYVCDCVCNGGCVRGSVYKAPRGSGRTVAWATPASVEFLGVSGGAGRGTSCRRGPSQSALETPRTERQLTRSSFIENPLFRLRRRRFSPSTDTTQWCGPPCGGGAGWRRSSTFYPRALPVSRMEVTGWLVEYQSFCLSVCDVCVCLSQGPGSKPPLLGAVTAPLAP